MFDIVKGCPNQTGVYIAGAHSRAQTLRAYLEYLYPEIKIVSYLVDDMSENRPFVDGIPVSLINNGGLQKSYLVYIATRGANHPKIIKELEEAGFVKIIPMTVELDRQLREEYVRRIHQEQGRNFLKIERLALRRTTRKRVPCDPKCAAIYVAKSVFDRPLKSAYVKGCYEKEIQAGASLTEDKICSLADNTGEHISGRNRQFCELTALYWIWKNSKEDILGLVHYRRHFLLPEDWLDRMLDNDVDVIVPVPLYVAPSLAENYKERHDPQVWNAMMQCLKERGEQEYEEAEVFFRRNLYCPCNMFIMHREVLDRMCGWLFPILFKVAERMGEREDPYQNRYPGFLSERLITFFLEKNKDRYKTVYADKSFLT